MMMRQRRECHRFQEKVHQKRAIMLPMLCSRPSIKDVHVIHRQNDTSSKADPTSPKITCIGQVKRCSNNRKPGVVFPNPHTQRRPQPIGESHVSKAEQYSKLKRFFSGRNLAVSSSPRRPIIVAELDPPLPVVINRPVCDQQDHSLWKRRSGGAAIKSLQLHRIHHPADHRQPTTV